jgi:hypothetical protein
MNTFQGLLHIESSEGGKRLQLAIDLLTNLEGAVLINDVLSLRPNPQGIECAVILTGLIDPQSQVENAKRLLEKSTIGQFVQSRKLRWIAVDDYGMGAIQIWPPRPFKDSVE